MQAVIRRTRFRVLIALAAVAVPLLAVGSAQAAMAGASPGTTSSLPDLRSASVTNTTPGNTTIQVCFDKAIGSVTDASQFFVGDYRQDEVQADSATRAANGNCADVSWTSTNIDFTQRTYVRAGNPELAQTRASGDCAVTAGAGTPNPGACNPPDSVPLVGSTSQNGLRGHAVTPDLTGIVPHSSPSAAPTVDFVFDQNIDSIDDSNRCYRVLLADGTVHFSDNNNADGNTFSGNTVTATFDPGELGNSSNPLVRATVDLQCVGDQTTSNPNSPDAPFLYNLVPMTAPAPNQGLGSSDRPDLVGVTVVPDGSEVDFTFDENVTPAAIGNGPDVFGVADSDGQDGCSNINPIGPADIAGTTVRIKATNLHCTYGPPSTSPSITSQLQNEYFVWGAVGIDAVASATNPGVGNPEAGQPAGSNASGSANGFTTGPEAFSASFDPANSQVFIRLDQRYATSEPSDVYLIGDTGLETPINANSITALPGSNITAGPSVAIAHFNTGQVQGARGVLLQSDYCDEAPPGGEADVTYVPRQSSAGDVCSESNPSSTWYGSNGPDSWFGTNGAFTTYVGYSNVDQFLSPTAAAAKHVVKRHGKVVRHHARKHVRVSKRQHRAFKRLHRLGH